MDYAAHERSGTLAAGSDALDAAWVNAQAQNDYDISEELVAVIGKARRLTGRAGS